MSEKYDARGQGRRSMRPVEVETTASTTRRHVDLAIRACACLRFKRPFNVS
jgi:hypothetical protein